MTSPRVVIIGGGAAGFFAAIACAQESPQTEVLLLEKGPQFLTKVKISGGGRCNVTHACFEPREMTTRYPRGARALMGAFHRFQARDTVQWFQSRGVKLKTEKDGRMFPTTDQSTTIIDCLMVAAREAKVKMRAHAPVEQVKVRPGGGFEIFLPGDERLEADAVLIAIGGVRAPALGQLAITLGHTLQAPVPSLFTFQIETPWLRALAGTTVEKAKVSIPQASLSEEGPLLVTHWGLSGPAILKLSAWGARELHALDYKFELLVNWLPGLDEARLANEFQARRTHHPARTLANAPIAPLTARLWEQLVVASGIPSTTRWASFSKSEQNRLTQQLTRTAFPVTGKSLNKDEFVTCGGIPLREVEFKTMESRVCPGLYFAGEVLDVDGITGGFNFQAAWTTGWIAGKSMAARVRGVGV